MDVPVIEWEENEFYLNAKNVVKNFRIVNDSAERGVKLGNDFIDSAKLEDRYQNVLQVVENDRKRIPNQRNKNKISEPNVWFLTLED